MCNCNGIIYYKIKDDPDGMRYQLAKEFKYYSRLFNRTITIPKGRKSDGATGARDLGAIETGWRGWWSKAIGKLMHSPEGNRTAAWFVHDELCITGCWDDGTKISNFVCSTVLSVILYSDGYKRESISWWFATFFKGGGKARENGMLWVKKAK